MPEKTVYDQLREQMAKTRTELVKLGDLSAAVGGLNMKRKYRGFGRRANKLSEKAFALFDLIDKEEALGVNPDGSLPGQIHMFGDEGAEYTDDDGHGYPIPREYAVQVLRGEVRQLPAPDGGGDGE